MEGLCGASGAPTVYSVPDGQWVMNLVNFFGGGCNKVTTPNYSFVRCF